VTMPLLRGQRVWTREWIVGNPSIGPKINQARASVEFARYPP
jgi:hypothetical protein